MNSACEDKPVWVLGKKSTGINFNVPLKYKGLFAEHKLTGGYTINHPSQKLISEWRNHTSALVTGKLANTYKNQENPIAIAKTKNKITTNMRNKSNMGFIVGNTGNKNKMGFIIRSYLKTGEAPSVASYAQILKQLNQNYKYRSNPLEYKRILDYLQFTLVETINDNRNNYQLYRPNNLTFINYISSGTKALPEVYRLMRNDPTMTESYERAIFASSDRVAALAAINRNIPTIYVKQSKYYYVTDNSNIKSIINKNLEAKGINNINDYIERGNSLINYKINKTKFDNLKSADQKVAVLYYWMYNFPSDKKNTLLNYFFSIIDTFHDFTGTRATTQLGEIWPLIEKNAQSSPYKNASAKNLNKINNNATTSTSKFLVALLGKDIYQAVGKYNKNAVKVVSNVNRRTSISNPQKKLANLLYYFTNILGSEKSIITKIEDQASEIITKMTAGNDEKPLCNELVSEDRKYGKKHAIIADYLSSRMPDCMIERSVSHNVGYLDPAKGRKFYTWSSIIKSCPIRSNNNNNNNSQQRNTKRARR
jgi:hypothetical protein